MVLRSVWFSGNYIYEKPICCLLCCYFPFSLPFPLKQNTEQSSIHDNEVFYGGKMEINISTFKTVYNQNIYLPDECSGDETDTNSLIWKVREALSWRANILGKLYDAFKYHWPCTTERKDLYNFTVIGSLMPICDLKVRCRYFFRSREMQDHILRRIKMIH